MGRSVRVPQFWPCYFSTWFHPYTARVNSEINRQLPRPYLTSFTAFPSFEPEWGVRIGGQKGQHYLGVVIFLYQVWSQMMDQAQSPVRSVWNMREFGPRVLAFRFAISNQLATLLHTAVAQAERDSGSFYSPGVDGVGYQFSNIGGFCTATWSPDPGSDAGQLVAIFRSFRQLVFTKTQTGRKRVLGEAIEKLQEFVRHAGSDKGQ